MTKSICCVTRVILALGFLVFLSGSCLASDVPDVGEGVCVANCGDGGNTGGSGGGSGGGSSGGYVGTYVPSGPSPEQLRQQREEKDLQEAALDANDRGAEAYKSGDYAGAVKYLSEAFEYSPDDADLQHNLARAQEALRQSEAARQLKSVEAHSTTARQLRNEPSSMEARLGFDTAGKSAGSLDTSVVYAGDGAAKEPVVPDSKRTPKITTMERQRNEAKIKIAALEAKLEALDPQKDSVKISAIKQEESKEGSQVQYLNFSIGEELDKPSPDSGKKL